MGIAEEKYANVTTFTRDGRPKTTPIWPVDAGDGRVGLITSDNTWKVKRLGNDNRVEIQPSDARGNPTAGTEAMSGTGVVVYGADFERIKSAVRAKYGWQSRAIELLGRLRGLRARDDAEACAVIITLDGPA